MRVIRKHQMLASRLFWGGMLVGHFPLILKASYGLLQGAELASNGKSLLTLIAASAFFVFKLAGGKFIQNRPTFYQIVAFCLLGIFLHIFLFPPTVIENPLEFLMLKMSVATITVIATFYLIAAIRSSRGQGRWVPILEPPTLFSSSFHKEKDISFPCLEVLSDSVIRRGPPIVSC